jgi:SAM-dependent methyltransferase
MALSSRVANVWSTVRSRGVREAQRFVWYRLYEELQEKRLGIRTTGIVTSQELRHESPELLEYAPSPYHALRYCLAQLAVRTGEDALLDYGCGMGRAVVLAATKPFRRVVGVEISPALAAVASENVRRARKRLKCEVHLEVADATTYPVPDDITVVHLFNPFTGDTLARTVGNIQESLRRKPRDLTIVFGNPVWFEEMFGGEKWLERVASRDFYPDIGYAIYACRVVGPCA